MRALGTGSDLLTCDGAPLAVGVATLLRQVPPPPLPAPNFMSPLPCFSGEASRCLSLSRRR